LSLSLTEKTSLNFFVNLERIKSTMAESQTFTTADWFAKNVDLTIPPASASSTTSTTNSTSART